MFMIMPNKIIFNFNQFKLIIIKLSNDFWRPMFRKIFEFIDNLIPFEKEIYMNLLVAFLKEEERRMKAQQAAEARGG